MQSDSREPLLNTNLKVIVFLLIAVMIIVFGLYRNIFSQSTYLLKSFGESSVEPEVAFKNNKPTFLEFYAEWCEVCKEMAPEVFALKKEYEKEVNFVFLNVDNQKWDKYIRKFDVNGIPQLNLFDEKGNLISTFIGKQKEITIKESLANLKREIKSNEEILNYELSAIKKNKNYEITPRSHG
mgnify:CR=1 FL=1